MTITNIKKYGATWCRSCHKVDIVLGAFEKKHRAIAVERVDIDLDCGGASALIGLGIRSIPTLLFYQGSQLVGHHVGACTLEELEEVVQDIDNTVYQQEVLE